MAKKKKAGRLDVEVAADIEQYEKDMKKVREEGERTARSLDRTSRISEHKIRRVTTIVAKAIRGFVEFGAQAAQSLALLSVIVGRGNILRGFYMLSVAVQKLGGTFAHMAIGIVKAFLPSMATINKVMEQTRLVMSSAIAGMLAPIKAAGAAIGSVLGPALAAVGSALAPVVIILNQLSGGLLAKAANQFMALGGAAGGVATKGLGMVAAKMSVLTKMLGKAGMVAVKGLSAAFGALYSATVEVARFGFGLLGKALVSLGDNFRKANGELTLFGKALNGLGHGASKLGKVFRLLGAALFSLKGQIIIGATAMVVAANKFAEPFERAMARVRTLMPDVDDLAFSKLSIAVNELSGSFNVSADELAGGFYQVLSALPKLVKAPEKALMVLEAATKATATGFTEMDTAVRAITGIMNAFNLEADKAIEISDALFAAQNQGVTTFGEMAAEIGKVASLSAVLGSNWRDLLAIIAATTPFATTSEVITQLRSAIQAVIDQTPIAQEAVRQLQTTKPDFRFDVEAIDEMGLLGFFRQVAEATEGEVETIAQLFGRQEAILFITNLQQAMGDLDDKAAALNDTLGTTDQTLEIITNTVEEQEKALKQKISKELRAMGLAWKSTKSAALSAVEGILDFFIGIGEAADSANEGVVALGESLREVATREMREFLDFLGMLDEDGVFAGDKGEVGITIESVPYHPLRPRSYVEEGKIFFKPSEEGPSEIPLMYDKDLKPVPGEYEPGSPQSLAIVGAMEERVKDYAEALDFQARMVYYNTRSQEAYEAQLKENASAMNTYVGELISMANATGAAEQDIQKLGSYMVILNDSLQSTKETLQAARQVLTPFIKDIALAHRIGAEPLPADEMHPELRRAFDEVHVLEARIKAVTDGLGQLTAEEQAAARVVLGHLRAQHAAAEQTAARMAGVTAEMESGISPASQLRMELAQMSEIAALGYDPFGEIPEQAINGIMAIGQLKAQIEELKIRMAQVSDQPLLAEAERQLAGFQGKLLEMQGAMVRESLVGPLFDQLDEVGDHLRAAFLTLGPDLAGQVTETLLPALEMVATAQREYNEALVTGDEEGKAAAVKKLATAQSTLQKEVAGLAKKLKESGEIGNTVYGQLLETLLAILQAMTDIEGKLSEKQEAWIKLATNVEGFARGVLSVADAMGILDSASRQALQGVIDLASGVKRLVASGGADIGAWAQSIGGLIGLASGFGKLFGLGESAYEREHREKLVNALDRLRDSVDAANAAYQQIPGGLHAALAAGIEGTFVGPSGVPQVVENLRARGVTPEDIHRLAGILNMDLSQLERALEGLGHDAQLAAWEIQALWRAIQEMQMAQLIETWAGKVRMLQGELEVFDIDDPIKRLEKWREAFLAFSNIPEKVKKDLEAFELDTPEGRAAFEMWIEEMYRRLMDPALSMENLEWMGDLSPEEWRQALEDLEGWLDDIQEKEGDEEAQKSVGIFRGVTEVTANRLVGIGQTQIVLLQEAVAIWRAMADAQGVNVPTLLPPIPYGPSPEVPPSLPGPTPPSTPPPSAPAPPAPAGGGAGSNPPVTVHSIQVNAPISVEGVTDAQSFVDIGTMEIERQISERVRRRMMAKGVRVE